MSEATNRLGELGQSLWLDGVSRTLLRSGEVSRYIAELAVTGLRFDLPDFHAAMGAGDSYDDSIKVLAAAGLSDEDQFFELALEDLTQAAELLRPVFDDSGGKDGWVSLGISPLLADNATLMIQAASVLHAKAALANLLVQIPATAEGVRAIEDVVFNGVPVEITLVFSPEQYVTAAQACMRGLERRRVAGLDVSVNAVITILVNPWDVQGDVPSPFHDRLGIAMAMRTYRAYREQRESAPWKALVASGARAGRLMWAGMAVSDAAASDTLYVNALVAPSTIACLPCKTLLAFAAHGRVGQPLTPDAGYGDAVIDEFRRSGLDDVELGNRLQREALENCSMTWHAMLSRIRDKGASHVDGAADKGVR